jgi:hypothetical protein
MFNGGEADSAWREHHLTRAPIIVTRPLRSFTPFTPAHAK